MQIAPKCLLIQRDKTASRPSDGLASSAYGTSYAACTYWQLWTGPWRPKSRIGWWQGGLVHGLAGLLMCAPSASLACRAWLDSPCGRRWDPLELKNLVRPERSQSSRVHSCSLKWSDPAYSLCWLQRVPSRAILTSSLELILFASLAGADSKFFACGPVVDCHRWSSRCLPSTALQRSSQWIWLLPL